MRINQHYKIQSGFSLIELVIFIIILAIALTAISLVYIQTTRNSADPIMRIKSVELAQITLNEILSKAYDDNTPTGGGCVQMTVPSKTRCTSGITPASDPDLPGPLGAEEGTATPANPEIRASFNDVDDYYNVNGLAYCGVGGIADSSCTDPCIDLVNEAGASIKNEYPGYAICIHIGFAGGAGTEISNFSGGVSVLELDAKKIDVIVTDPIKSKISLSAYSLNY